MAISFKHHHMASCTADTPIAQFLLDSADVDHLAVSVWCDWTEPFLVTGVLFLLHKQTMSKNCAL